MPRTPNLPDLDGGYSLRPVAKAILPMVIEAYTEDPESAKAALPWLKNDEGSDEKKEKIYALFHGYKLF